MGTIIDSLVVELELDPTKFKKAEAEATANWGKVRVQFKSDAKEIEKSAQGASDSIDKVTKSALALFGVLVGAHGIKDFIQNVTTTDAAVGRLSTNLNMSAKDLQAWQNAAVRMGGSADATAGSIRAASDQLSGLRSNGTPLPQGLARMFSAAGMNPNLTGSTQDYLLSISSAAQAAARTAGPQMTAYWLTQSGFDQSTANLMMAQGANMQGFLGGIPGASDKTIANMEDLQTRWTKLQQTVGSTFNNFFGDAEPALRPWLDDFQKLADELQKDEPAFAAFAKDAADISNSLGQWRIATEALIALWAGGKIVGMVSAIRGLLGGGAAAGGGLTGWATGAISAASSTAVGAAMTVGGMAAGMWLASTTGAGTGEDALVHSLGLGGTSHEAYIRRRAAALGIDPDVALRVARGEGLGGKYSGDDNSSFGDFQLHYGGVSGAFPHAGLGDAFTKATGLDARDPDTWQQQIDFALQWASTHGWGDWSGAKAAGITGKMGVYGSPGLANAASWANLRGGMSSSTTQVNVNGPIHITVPGGDAHSIATNLHGALKRAAATQYSNSGPA